MSDPWGHVIRLSIYVEGERRGGEIDALQAAADALEARGYKIYNAGAMTSKVDREPIGQGESFDDLVRAARATAERIKNIDRS